MEKMALNEQERNMLLKLAKASVRAVSHRRALPEVPADLPVRLSEECGAFVTLNHRGRLRGCVGLIQSCYPLALTVVRMAASAAQNDPRFRAVSPYELSELAI